LRHADLLLPGQRALNLKKYPLLNSARGDQTE